MTHLRSDQIIEGILDRFMPKVEQALALFGDLEYRLAETERVDGPSKIEPGNHGDVNSRMQQRARIINRVTDLLDHIDPQFSTNADWGKFIRILVMPHRDPVFKKRISSTDKETLGQIVIWDYL